MEAKLISVKAKPAASLVKGANSSRSAHNVAKGASNAKDDMSKTLMVVLGEVAVTTKRKVGIIRLEQKDALKRVATHIEMEPQAAFAHIPLKLERGDSDALHNVPTCRAVLHRRAQSLP